MLLPDGTTAVSSISKAELFSQTFYNNSALDDSGHIHSTFPPSDYTLPIIIILKNDVFYALSGLNPQKAYGPDGVPPIVLKNCASVLTPYLAELFQLRLSTSTFPSCWKYAYVQPVPKKGDRSNPLSYRPIALLSCLSKAFESILNKKLLKHLSTSDLLSDRQYGFRKGRSTGDLLAFLGDSWSSSLMLLSHIQVCKARIATYDQNSSIGSRHVISTKKAHGTWCTPRDTWCIIVGGASCAGWGVCLVHSPNIRGWDRNSQNTWLCGVPRGPYVVIPIGYVTRRAGITWEARTAGPGMQCSDLRAKERLARHRQTARVCSGGYKYSAGCFSWPQ